MLPDDFTRRVSPSRSRNRASAIQRVVAELGTADKLVGAYLGGGRPSVLAAMGYPESAPVRKLLCLDATVVAVAAVVAVGSGNRGLVAIIA